jgi:hypothetical protein
VNLIERAAGFFVTPVEGDRDAKQRRLAVSAASAPTAVVLGAPEDALTVGRLLAADLRLRAGGGCVLVGEWSGRAAAVPPSRPAHPSTRRLADRLAGRGLEGCARGRTVHLVLPADPGAAVAAWQRAGRDRGSPSGRRTGGAAPHGVRSAAR